MPIQDYQLHRDFFKIARWSKAGIVFLLISIVGCGLIFFAGSYHFSRDLGIALVPVGLIALAYELFLRQEFLGEMKLELSESLASHFDQFDRLRRAGVHDVVDTFPTTEVAKQMGGAENIRIVQTWIPDIITLLKPIVSALKRGAKARIVLLDPDSELASYRAKSLRYMDGTMASNNIRANLAEISRAAHVANVADRLEVRLFDALPIACIHAYDNEAVVGFFWQGIPAISGPQLVISRADSPLMATLDEHFENLWNDSRPYQLVAINSTSSH